MTDEQKRSITAWWWGRNLPESHSDLYRVSLNKLTDNQYEVLESLKNKYEKAQEDGITLNWGRHIKVSELFKNA